MAHFTPFNRKAALLLARFGGRGSRDGNKKPAALGGVTLNTVRFWRRSESDYKDSKKVSDALKSHLPISDPRDLLSEGVTVKEFSSFLGYTIQQGREIIDQAYSELYPIYSVFYSNPRLAEDIVERFGQFHLIYRLESGERIQDFTKRDENIVQIPLTVRYMLKGTKPSVDEQYRVRCKLNIPSYTAATSCFEYDGYVTPQKDNTHYWLFENRSEENKDLIFMITDTMQIIRHHHESTITEHHFTQGIMLTRRQDAWPIHKIWKIVMLKIEPDDCAFFDPSSPSDTESAFMAGQCKVVAYTDVPPWIADILAAEWKGLEFSFLPGREAP